jgi:LAO/AO transport system kinase
VDLTQLRASLTRGEKAALAVALAGIERDPDSAATPDQLDSS